MKGVLPAYAGMIPPPCSGLSSPPGAPRVCGDDPSSHLSDSLGAACSPRMRG